MIACAEWLKSKFLESRVSGGRPPHGRSSCCDCQDATRSGAADGVNLRPLRRPAAGALWGMEDATVRTGDTRRRVLCPRLDRQQGSDSGSRPRDGRASCRERRAAGESPLLVEGEEEIGSDNLAPFLEENRADLDCDVIVISDTGMAAHGYPTLTFSLRGIAALEFNVHGPSTGLAFRGIWRCCNESGDCRCAANCEPAR